VLQEKIEFWNNVWGFKMEPIKALARSEPLVDNVSSDLMTTSIATIADINVTAMSEEDIPFASEFELEARRDDHMHAIVLWFDIFFGSSHKQVRACNHSELDPWGAVRIWCRDVHAKLRHLQLALMRRKPGNERTAAQAHPVQCKRDVCAGVLQHVADDAQHALEAGCVLPGREAHHLPGRDLQGQADVLAQQAESA
jgi:hypothetical protein